EAPCRLAGEEGALEIHRQREIKIFLAIIFRGIFGRDPGVIDEDIEAAEAVNGVLNGARDLVEAGYIHLQRQSLAAHALNLANEVGGGIDIAQARREIGTSLSQTEGNRTPQSEV